MRDKKGKFIEIRIKRFRTYDRVSIWEVLERWAEEEGRNLPSAIEHLLNQSPAFRKYLSEARNPGRETT